MIEDITDEKEHMDDERTKARDLMTRIVRARDQFTEYFSGKEIIVDGKRDRTGGILNRDGVRYETRPTTCHYPILADAEVISRFGRKREETVGNRFKLPVRGIDSVSVRVIFDETKEPKGLVRVTVNDSLSTPLKAFSEDEAGRTLELYGELRKYFESRAEFIGFHDANDGSPQRRYVMREI